MADRMTDEQSGRDVWTPATLDAAYRPRLLRFVRALVADDGEADEVVATALATATERASVMTCADPAPELFTIAKRRAGNALEKRDRRRNLAEVVPTEPGELAIYAHALAPPADDTVIEHALIADAFDTLPPKSRSVVWDHMVQGVPFEVIAKATDSTPGAVKKHYERSRAALVRAYTAMNNGGASAVVAFRCRRRGVATPQPLAGWATVAPAALDRVALAAAAVVAFVLGPPPAAPTRLDTTPTAATGAEARSIASSTPPTPTTTSAPRPEPVATVPPPGSSAPPTARIVATASDGHPPDPDDTTPEPTCTVDASVRAGAETVRYRRSGDDAGPVGKPTCDVAHAVSDEEISDFLSRTRPSR